MRDGRGERVVRGLADGNFDHGSSPQLVHIVGVSATEERRPLLQCGVLPASSHGRRTPPARSCVRARGNARRPRQGHVSPYTTIGTRRGSREGTPSPAGGLVALDATAGEGPLPGVSALSGMRPVGFGDDAGGERDLRLSRVLVHVQTMLRVGGYVEQAEVCRDLPSSPSAVGRGWPWRDRRLLTHGPTEPKGVNGLPTRSPRSQTGSAAAFSAAVSPRARWCGRTRLPPAIAVNRFDNRQTGGSA
jgi:hypothetical protein